MCDMDAVYADTCEKEVGVTLSEILSDIHAINNTLVEFERRYGLLSETFFTWYQEGNEPEDDDWVLDFSEWAGLYKSRERLLALYQECLRELIASGRTDFNQIIQDARQQLPA